MKMNACLDLSGYPDLIGVNDLSSILGLSNATIYRMINRGELPYTKIGKLYKFPKRQIIKYLNAKSNYVGD